MATITKNNNNNKEIYQLQSTDSSEHESEFGLDASSDLRRISFSLCTSSRSSGECSSSLKGTVPFISILEATKRAQHLHLYRAQFLFQHQRDCCTQNGLQNLCVEASVCTKQTDNLTHTYTTETRYAHTYKIRARMYMSILSCSSWIYAHTHHIINVRNI